MLEYSNVSDVRNCSSDLSLELPSHPGRFVDLGVNSQRYFQPSSVPGMDSTLEDEIARLSRPQTTETDESLTGTGSAGIAAPSGHYSAHQPQDVPPSGMIIAHGSPPVVPSSTIIVASGRPAAANTNAQRRMGSGEQLPRQGSGKSGGTGRTSPPTRAAGLTRYGSSIENFKTCRMLSVQARVSQYLEYSSLEVSRLRSLMMPKYVPS